MSNTPDGLSGKYIVERADGQQRPRSRYFVLNYVTDPYAREAMRTYAGLCADTHPGLADDLVSLADHYDEVDAARTRRADPTRPAPGQHGSGGDPATDEDLLALVVRRAETDPEFAARVADTLS